MAASNIFRAYYYLTKPGIIYGNAVTTIAGFLVADTHPFKLSVFLAMLIGTSLVIGGACVFNNYLDRNIDKRMERTRKRALASGQIGVAAALTYGSMLVVLGFALLIWRTNWLTALIGLIALVDYVALYGYAKRHSWHSTLVGSISGAAPITAGYTAATGQWSAAAFLLFLTMVVWQMPHFYAIAIYRQADYRAAGLPIASVKFGEAFTAWLIRGYLVALVALIAGLLLGGVIKLLTSALLLSALAVWLRLAVVNGTNLSRWASKNFGYSLLFVLLLSVVLSLNRWL